MNRFINSIGGLIGVLFLLVLLAANFYGPYHAFTKHGTTTGFVSVFVPPYAWYQAAEGLFWHDDFADVDWDIRLKNDVKSLAVLLAVASNDIDETRIEKFGEAVESLGKKFQKYPTDKVQYLEEFANVYLLYTNSTMEDMMRSLRGAIYEQQRFGLVFSSETERLEERVRQFKGSDEMIGEFKSVLKVLNAELERKDPVRLSRDKAEFMLKVLEAQANSGSNRMRNAYADIFGHAPNENL